MINYGKNLNIVNFKKFEIFNKNLQYDLIFTDY